MLTAAGPALLHAIGYVTGATLYAMLLVMVLRAPAADRLMVVTGALGLVWNVGELLAGGIVETPFMAAAPWLHATAYAALGALATVVIHSVARRPGDAGPGGRWLPAIAYASAGVATLLHAGAAAAGGSVPSRAALVVVTGAVVLLALVLLTASRGGRQRRVMWMTALTLFAVSAMHLGTGHEDHEPLAFELLGHHASIPLAFAILYEDFRFALADLFLKRALTLLAVVAVVVAAWTMVPHGAADSVASEGMLLVLWVASALLVPFLQRAVSGFVDRFVLRRAGHDDVMERVAAALEHDREEALLEGVSAALAPALSATSVGWIAGGTPAGGHHGRPDVAVPTTEPPHYRLVVGPLADGRRLLSGDLALLERVAVLTARRIDALRLTDERYERMLREREMQALATEAELRALRAQINPHFLFNALTTIGYLIQQAPPRALDTLLRLTTLLRSVLRPETEFTTLAHERELLTSYLQIEQARFEERLTVLLDIPADLNHIRIPSLIVQPLVENAITHGVAPSRDGGVVQVQARIIGSGDGSSVEITVRNTGAPADAGRSRRGSGVGLQNVERRLAGYYGEGAQLELLLDTASGTVARVTLPVSHEHGSMAAVPSKVGRP